MTCLRAVSLVGRLRLPALAIVFWTAFERTAWAQDAVASEKSYVMAYALIVLAVGLALLLVLRPSRRTTEVKPLRED